MKVIKPGEILAFDCEECGCEFVAGIKAVVDCGFFYKAQCPVCGCEVHAKAVREDEKEV